MSAGRIVTWLDAMRQDTSLKRAPRILELWWRLKWWAGRLVCIARRQCNFDTYAFRPSCLYFCTRCGREITGRTFSDLVPDSSERSDFMTWDDEA